MKFTKLMLIAFVIVVMSCLAPTRGTVVGGSGIEEKAACVVTDLMSCLPGDTEGKSVTSSLVFVVI